MDSLKSIQAIIELVQKRPLISLLCLICLMLIVFSPLILSLAPSNRGHSEKENNAYPTLPVISTEPRPQPIGTLPRAGALETNAQEDWKAAPVSVIQPARETGGITPFSITANKINSVVAPLSNARYFIVVASRPDRQSAIEAADTYAAKGFSAAEVHRTPNGWYAVTIGHYPSDEAKRILKEATLSQSIPGGAWLSPGKEWLGKVYP